jgi:hypothetical protein
MASTVVDTHPEPALKALMMGEVAFADFAGRSRPRLPREGLFPKPAAGVTLFAGDCFLGLPWPRLGGLFDAGSFFLILADVFFAATPVDLLFGGSSIRLSVSGRKGMKSSSWPSSSVGSGAVDLLAPVAFRAVLVVAAGVFCTLPDVALAGFALVAGVALAVGVALPVFLAGEAFCDFVADVLADGVLVLGVALVTAKAAAEAASLALVAVVFAAVSMLSTTVADVEAARLVGLAGLFLLLVTLAGEEGATEPSFLFEGAVLRGDLRAAAVVFLGAIRTDCTGACSGVVENLEFEELEGQREAGANNSR